ncbi:MAG TPA: carboxypeptidase regulatory-like domain-containing protein, partial [Blastocatellia bacterium]
MKEKAYVFSRAVGSLCLFLAMTWNFTALAQSTATLHGTITDPQGAVVTGAKVTILNVATGVERTIESDSAGNYLAPALPVGTYRVEVNAQGFEKTVLEAITLEVSQTVEENIQLKVGGTGQEVTITTEAPVVDSSDTTVGQVINDRTVQEIPLNGRHFVDLGLLIPGTMTPPQNGFLTAPLRGQGSFAIDTSGNREDTTNWMINGINLNDMAQNQITFQPSISTVQEFKVDNQTFSAEYGRNSGSIANVATRSGTNDFHGEAFEFFRNNDLDARNFFVSQIGEFRRNQFGGDFGGPIKKDKLFFFFSYEGTRQRQAVPTEAGVLSQAQRAAVTDPAAQKLLPLIPQPNSTIATSSGPIPAFVGSASAPVDIDQWTLDIGYNLGLNDHLHGYYAFQRDMRNEPTLQGDSIPGFGDTRQSHRQIFTLNETHSFGSTVVNDARVGYSRIFITFSPIQDLNPENFGINVGVDQNLALPQTIIESLGLDFGGPAAFPQGRGDTTYVASDTLSYLHGNHSFKFGGEFRTFLNNNFEQDAGVLEFTNPAEFAQGGVSVFTNTVGGVFSSLATKSVGLFAIDSYKIKPGLTLDLGFRYDVNTPPSERYNRFAVFNPATDSLAQTGSIYDTNLHNFEPRIGFAWDPFHDDKTVVRGAYAILYQQPTTNSVTGPTANPPLADPVQAVSSASTIPLENPLGAAAAGGLAPSAIDGHFKESYVQDWNLNVQRQISPTLGVMVGYFASKGTHLQITENLNQFVDGVRPFPALSLNSPIDPGKTLGNIPNIEGEGNSSYQALWVTANKRVGRGLQFNASYTFS